MTGFTLFSLTPKEEKQRRGCNPLPEHYVKCWKMTRLLAEKMSKPWEMLESYVEFVYQSLLDLGNDNVVVGRDVTLTGRTGIPHQIDVYYEFEKAGFRHRVAIECRHKSRAIDKNQVIAFKGTVEDIPGLQGIMVALKGYQSGARRFADDNGILAIDITELPSLGMLMGARI